MRPQARAQQSVGMVDLIKIPEERKELLLQTLFDDSLPSNYAPGPPFS